MELHSYAEDKPLIGTDLKTTAFLYISISLCFATTFLCFFLLNTPFFCIFFYTLGCCILVPLAFLQTISNNQLSISYYLTGETNFKQNYQKIFFIILLIFIITFVTLFLISPEVRKYQTLSIQLLDTRVTRNLFRVFFCFVLPIAEEFYWRTFLLKSFPNSPASQVIIHGSYGLLAGLVFLRLFQWQIYLLGAGFFFLVSLFLVQIKRRFLLMGSILAQIAFRTAIMIVIGIYFGNRA